MTYITVDLTQYLKHDGTVAATGNFDFGGYNLTEVAHLTGSGNLVLNSKAPASNNMYLNAALINPTGNFQVDGSTDFTCGDLANITSISGASPALIKVSTTTVAFNAVAATTLYTVPAGKTFMPAMAIIRAGADAGATDVTFGRVGALTDWLGTIQLDNLDAAGDQVKVETTNANPPTKSKTYAAAVVFQIDVTVANGGATNYVDLFGYLI